MRIHHIHRRTLLLAGAGALAGCASPATAADPVADAQFRDLVDRLGERSRSTRAFLLRRFDASRLTAEGRILYEAVLPGAEADAALAGRSWGDNGLPYAVTHRYGAWRRASELRADEDPDRSAVSVQDDTNRLLADAGRHVIPPDFLLDATIEAVGAAAARVLGQDGDRYEPLGHALTRQLEVLRDLRPRAPASPGVWQFRDGEEFFAQTLQFHYGAPLEPRAAYDLALARVRELQADADALLRAEGFTHGDVGERLRALAALRPGYYGQDASGKAAAVADMNAQLDRARELLAQEIAGAADAQAEVRLLPAQYEAGGAQGRRAGTIYYVDLGAPRPRWTLPSVVHHELIPGHILQAQHETAASAPPLQLRYAAGYGEGWATYAEQLAADTGAFAGDRMARLGYLQWMLFRMARVVADIGIHALRWERARAIEEMRALQGDPIAFVSIEEDVTRIAAQPGAHAAQGLVALHLASLRQRTLRAAGATFNPRLFHAAMLRYGPLSPPGLEQAALAAFGQ